MSTRIKGRFYAARGREHAYWVSSRSIDWDDFEVIPRLAHENGLKAYLYVSLFDEGWLLEPRKIREISCHNVMHGQYVTWQSSFSRKHPEYALVDCTGKNRQWDERSKGEEAELLALPCVKGLVFSSFRYDNPGPAARGDWRA